MVADLWTYPSNVTSLTSLVAQMNMQLGGLISWAIIILVFFIVFISTKVAYNTERAGIIASWFTFIISIFLFTAGMFSWFYEGLLIIILLATVMIVHLSNSGDSGGI
jgi:hypothetical protein